MINRQHGFTLIEILAAVAIIAIALSAVISGVTRYADNAGHLRNKTVALWVAHNRLTELRVQPGWPELGKSDGDTELAGAEWRWFVEVLETEDPDLRRVDIRVQRIDGDHNLFTLSGFLAKP